MILFLLLNLNYLHSQEIFAFQEKRNEFNKILINRNVINKISKKRFVIGYEYEGCYLGKIKTKKGQEYYLVNSSWVNLKNLHNSNEIFLYNRKKQFVGYYNLATNYQLPTKLLNNILFFKTDNCYNKIDLSRGIPKFICLGCKKNEDCIEFE